MKEALEIKSLMIEPYVTFISDLDRVCRFYAEDGFIYLVLFIPGGCFANRVLVRDVKERRCWRGHRHSIQTILETDDVKEVWLKIKDLEYV